MTRPCMLCGYRFDQDLLGRHGCPNCIGEGLDESGGSDMAYALIPAPGTDGGPCLDDSCPHRDCSASRWMAASLCVHCNEPIGYERAFCDHVAGDQLAHFSCAAEAAEGRVAWVGRRVRALGPTRDDLGIGTVTCEPVRLYGRDQVDVRWSNGMSGTWPTTDLVDA